MGAAFSVSIQEADFDIGAETALLQREAADAGALAVFVGTVRNADDGAAVQGLELEHYPGMAEKAILGILEEAGQRWTLQGARVVHRTGRLAAGEQIVLAAAAARHRGAAFAACEYIMDYLKTQAPIWKREICADSARWVAYRESDSTAAARWAEQGSAEEKSA